MGNRSSNAILRRKTLAAREVHQARVLSPEKALRLALARAAEEALDFALAVGDITVEAQPMEEAVADLPDAALTLLLEGEGGGAGAMSLDFALMSALVEVQTMGRLQRAPPEPRRPTRTDAALTAPLVDAAFAQLEELLQGAEAGHWLSGYRFGAMMEGPRMLGLALDTGTYHRLRLTLDLGGQREGQMQLLLPEREKPRGPQGAGETAQEAPLAHVIGLAQADLTAQLHRLSLPWNALLKLKPGDVLPVPREALSRTVLLGPGQVRILTVKLGQINGYRAVRLSAGETPRAARTLASQHVSPEDTFDPPPVDMPEEPMPVPMSEPEMPEPEPPPFASRVEALPDLPDLSDLPGLGPEEAEEEAFPMAGFPMADLPDLD
ncbi:FliM/FliN family flagellar motor switch protein [Pseudooceanicola nanhaiensis]|uniref:FliM/FliN family flagellar motor switch protein n=1 Tax=Pseudooceanicola nanhaiensis TaxID=375761 RepID=UPI001CD7A148|nr:FliM/FliN family flagellar motor switch protein [Pseudooceanicola nanhaiensis]MCA0919357.1 FliM/FliN family flagellar motor switch protein [Pseudooceanicola nanhaiensis]